MALSKTTQDHDEIQQWAEARGGKPAAVAATDKENSTGIIRIMFPDAPHANDSALEEISWEDFFEKFDASGLEFTYQEETAGGERSNFNKLTYPEVGSSGAKKIARKSAKKAATKNTGRKTAGKKIPSAKKTAQKKSPTAKKAGPPKASSVKKSAPKKAVKKTAPKKAAKTAAKKAAAKTLRAGSASQRSAAAKKLAGKKSPAKKSGRR